MPAEGHEIAHRTDFVLVQVERLGEELAYHRFRLGHRAALVRRGQRSQRFGFRQRLGVGFPVHRQRNGVDPGVVRRPQVVRQPGTGLGSDGREVGAVQHEVGGQPVRAIDLGIGLGDRGGEPHRRVRGERGLDLAQLDPVPADLDLLVGPAEVLEIPVEPPQDEIPGAVHAFAGRAERARDEPVGGLARLPEIAARDADPGHVQLAGHAVRHRPQPRVQDVPVGVVDRHAHNGIRAVEGADAEGVDRVFGGTVQVVAVGPVGLGIE